jgi:hypothetical protein
MNHKHLAMKLAVMALAGIMVASPAAWAKGKKERAEAVSGPSAQETVEFINGMWANKFRILHPISPVYSRQDDFQYNVKLERNNLQIGLDHRFEYPASNGTQYGTEEQSNSLPLDKLLPNVQVNTKGELELSCNPSAGACIENKKLLWTCTSGREFDGSACTRDTVENFRKFVDNNNLTSRTLQFPTPEGAERAAKALKHLIEISGGKASLF